MITKVNRPASLSLVPQSKAAQNDPGGSQGSGVFYEGPAQGQAQQDKKEASKDEKDDEQPSLSVVVSVEQVGMTEVVKDLLEKRADVPPANAGLTTTRYANDPTVAKGLLLNRKAE